ncbi:MAG: UDP-N-acetylmuramate dehydrogenase [Rickettsiaceae bacterium]|nr:UDP-N-acetylmuramate dehydrogenase [Rickettsiaceae bacterium]
MIKLPKVKGKYRINYPLAEQTWFKVGGLADIFFKPADVEDLIDFLKKNNQKLPITVLGTGSNIIIRDKGVDGVVIKLGRNFTDIMINDEGDLVVGTGCLNYNLAKFCQQNNISGFEFLIGIPGTIGGGIAMNAGAYGSEFKDIVKMIEAVDFSGNKKSYLSKEAGFTYRNNNLPENLIYTKVTFKINYGNTAEITTKMAKIKEERSKTQPINEKTSGSTFANPKGYKAWELIDKAGLRGKQIGGALISKLHCNFMINLGEATASDMEELGEFVRQEVKKNSGITLQWEIKRIGRK